MVGFCLNNAIKLMDYKFLISCVRLHEACIRRVRTLLHTIDTTHMGDQCLMRARLRSRM
jgi:hypothetical protein